MSPPLPVPSKAAIHALRGLALGTSCAIGVIVEDRRRRISTLRTAVSNKEKLRASRHYHGAVEYGALPSDTDDAVLLSRSELQWHRRTEDPDDHDTYSPDPTPTWSRTADYDAQDTTGDLEAPRPNKGASSTQEQQTEPPIHQTPEPAAPNIPPIVRPPLRNPEGWGRPKPINSLKTRNKSIDPTSIPRSINNILSTHDEENLDRALAKFFASPETSYMLEHVGDAWLDNSARLSKECQVQHRWEDAGNVLGRVLGAGPIDESRYYAHDPIPIIESYLPPEDSDTPCTPHNFSQALRLFLATFKEKPQTSRPEVEMVGKRLFEEALTLKQFTRIDSIYWRVLVQLEDASHFTAWAIKALSEQHDYKNVVKYFLLNFSKMNPNNTLFNETVDRVIFAVEAMQGLKAAQIFRIFARMENASNGSLKTLWIIKLLRAHWSRHQTLSKSMELFDEATALGLLDRVHHPYAVISAMIEFAIKADELAVAKSYYDNLVRLYPHMASDIPVNGYFAVAKAKAGDWDGVYESFMAMQPNRPKQQEEYNKAFIPVLKIFAEGHPVAEVWDFVKLYTGDLHVGMHRYMVTLVANKYGQCHDLSGFLAWLEYCHQAGFALDPVFCNAVLHNCRTRWKIRFKELKHLVSYMRQLNPSATDDTTERILSQAARDGGTTLRSKQIRRKSILINRLAFVGRSTNNRDVYEAMNQDIACGKPTAAISIYRRAMRFGMPFCGYCFRLALTAALAVPSSGKNGLGGPAFHLIHNAHGQGQDVRAAVSVFIRAQMDRFRAGTSDLTQHMQNLIARFEGLRIVIDPAVLTHAALVCVKLGQHGKAIALCGVAAERAGHPQNPCFSHQSFRALLLAYSQTVDAAGLDGLLGALLEHSPALAREKQTRQALKSALKEVQTYRQDPAAIATADLLRRAVDELKALRAENREEGRILQQETLRIMGDALADFQARERVEKGKTGGGGGKGGGGEDAGQAGEKEKEKVETRAANIDAVYRDRPPGIASVLPQPPESAVVQNETQVPPYIASKA